GGARWLPVGHRRARERAGRDRRTRRRGGRRGGPCVAVRRRRGGTRESNRQTPRSGSDGLTSRDQQGTGMETAIIVSALLLVLLAVALWYGLRWFGMRRRGGVSVALRWDPDRERSGWHLGIARYHGEEFLWYRVWSLRTGPD